VINLVYYCYNCGKELPEGAIYCTKCGTRTVLGGQSVNTPSDEMRETFTKMSQEMEHAFSLAAKELQEAFQTARTHIQKTASKELIICSNCSEKNVPNAKYCTKCGGMFARTEATSQANEKQA
jgi:ribosomal protein L40E